MQVRRQIQRIGRLVGAHVEQDIAYPGWAPNPNAEVVKIATDAIASVIGREPEVKAIHAGGGGCWRAHNPKRPPLEPSGLAWVQVEPPSSLFHSPPSLFPVFLSFLAGLECGMIGEKVPGTQSVSYGPTIRGAHSPDEKVQISTVLPFYQATLRVLEVLADRRG